MTNHFLLSLKIEYGRWCVKYIDDERDEFCEAKMKFQKLFCMPTEEKLVNCKLNLVSLILLSLLIIFFLDSCLIS